MTKTAVTKQEAARRAWRAMDHILAHPEQHEQGVWIKVPDAIVAATLGDARDEREHCGTKACLAGWVTLLNGDTPSFENMDMLDTVTDYLRSKDTGRVRGICNRASELLGIDDATADDLFDGSNSLGRLVELVIEIFGPRPAEAGSEPS